MLYSDLIKVLLIDDDEDDFVLTCDLFENMPGKRFAVDWASTFGAGLEAILRNQHDVCLVDYRLGPQSGIDLLRTAIARGCQAPVIVLTGAGQHTVDVEAMQAGAADYLVKAQLQADSLERSIRFALERKRAAAAAAFEQARLAAFGAEIGRVLTQRDPLDSLLDSCAAAMVQFLNVGLGQVLTFDPDTKRLEPRATRGLHSNQEGFQAAAVAMRWDLAQLAQGKPMLLNQSVAEAAVYPDWVKGEGFVAYAALPLLLEEKLVGLMSVFSQQSLGEDVIQEMRSVASGIAMCIERKRSEQALDRSEVKYRSVVESIKEVVFQLDEFGNWNSLNPAWTAVTGFEVPPTLGTFFLDYIYPEDQDYNRQVFLKLVESKLDFSRHEARLYTKDGKLRWVEFYCQPAVNERGAVSGASGTLTDITERKAAEMQIQKLAAFPQVNPNPVLEFAADGTMTHANDAAQEMVKSLGRKDVLSILPPNPDRIVRDCLADHQKKLRYEVTIQKRILSWSFFPVVASQVVHCYGADVTEVQNLEGQLRHAQKLESVGQLAAGVAHDLNNILTVIQGYSEFLLNSPTAEPAAKPAMEQISLAAQRAAGLTRQLLTFSRKQLVQPQPLDLNAVLRNLAKMLDRLVDEDITIDYQYASSLPCIEADIGMLEQIVVNLAVNARDAMPNGGRLRIATSKEQIDAGHVRTHAQSRAGSFVCLTVADTGCGMDQATLKRIFEPFFTTKEAGKGTGLGLATVNGIVNQLRGWVEVASEPARGTTFGIYFPLAVETNAGLSAADRPARATLGCQERILLVEDNPAVRQVTEDALCRHNYQVATASSGAVALQVWDAHDGKFDLLITDMVMPGGMSGLDLAAQFRRCQPALKVIVISGYSPETLGADSKPAGFRFLSKPFHPTQLAQLVRQCLDG